MPAELSDDELPLVVRALDHYHSYLVATQREGARYKELADRLQRKPPTTERGPAVKKTKRA